MKVFLSYSLNDSNLHVIPMLVNHLKNQGLEPFTSYQSSDNYPFNDFKSNNTSLFIALLTRSGKQSSKVLNEWMNAINTKIPTIALVENTVSLPNNYLHLPNILRFNIGNPTDAINQIQINRNDSIHSKKNDSNAMAWILGGIAAIALIKLLSDEDR